MELELWKDIPGFEGIYKVSNLGNIRSLERITIHSDGKVTKSKDRLLKFSKNKKGYFRLSLTDSNKLRKTYTVHQLVAMSFLNHKPCGMKFMVDHINGDILNNIVSNLRIVTNRENSSNRHINKTSKYVGVCYDKFRNKWISGIRTLNSKSIKLGRYNNEIDAYIAYKSALDLFNKGFSDYEIKQEIKIYRDNANKTNNGITKN